MLTLVINLLAKGSCKKHLIEVCSVDLESC